MVLINNMFFFLPQNNEKIFEIYYFNCVHLCLHAITYEGSMGVDRWICLGLHKLEAE
jgi:hypothetical protein